MNIRDLKIGHTYGVSTQVDSTYQNPWYGHAFRVKVLSVAEHTYEGSSGYAAFGGPQRKGATVQVIDTVPPSALGKEEGKTFRMVRLPGMHSPVPAKKGEVITISGRAIFCDEETWERNLEAKRKRKEARKQADAKDKHERDKITERMEALGIGKWAKSDWSNRFPANISDRKEWLKLLDALEKAREEDA
jgi:hypothetical protein